MSDLPATALVLAWPQQELRPDAAVFVRTARRVAAERERLPDTAA